MKMNKILYSLLISSILMVGFVFTSCMEVDNFSGPNARVSGRVIDATTGENYMTDQNDFQIRIWEKSYTEKPQEQHLAVKMDGTYNNDKLFAGTYDMLPYNGSYWPVDTVHGVAIGKHSVQNFEVTPYLKIKDFKAELVGTTLTMSCRLFAPIPQDLPQVLEVRPFLSLTQFCGSSNKIDPYYTDDYRVSLRKSWDQLGDVVTGEGNATYTITLPLKAGYSYNVRMGANVRDTFEKFNYSEVVRIEVPSEAAGE